MRVTYLTEGSVVGVGDCMVGWWDGGMGCAVLWCEMRCGEGKGGEGKGGVVWCSIVLCI